jgi:hypothetical protein
MLFTGIFSETSVRDLQALGEAFIRKTSSSLNMQFLHFLCYYFGSPGSGFESRTRFL